MKKKFEVDIPDGTYLAPSKESDGTVRGTLLDNNTKKIVGQAKFKEIDDDFEYNDNNDSYYNNYDCDNSNYSYDYEDEEDNENESDISLGGVLLASAGLLIGAKIISSFLPDTDNENDSEEMEREKVRREIEIEEYRRKENIKAEKKRIREEIRMEEYRQAEIRKSEKRMKRREKRRERNAVIRHYLKLGFINLCKGIYIAIKYLVIATIWCIRKLIKGIKILSIWAYKKIKKWINDRKAKKLEESLKENNISETKEESVTTISMAPEKFSILLNETFEEFQNNMTSEEAQIHFLKIILLSNELAKEIRTLFNSNITDDVKANYKYLEWQNAMEKLTTDKVAEYINYVLVNNDKQIEPSLIDSIKTNFYGESYDDKEFVPIGKEKIQEVLRLC